MQQTVVTYTPLSARRISYWLGRLILGLAVTMLPSVLIGGLIEHDLRAVTAFLASAIITAISGAAFWLFGRRAERMISRRDAVVVVALAWLFIGLFGGLPYLLDGSMTRIEDAYFESVSGFTTTGATVLIDIEGSLSMAGHFWRCLSHWLGGMGVIVLFVAIFPQLGVGGKLLFKSEVAGPIVEGLRPKIKETSAALWRTYALLTLCNFLCLWLISGLSWFDAICHAFSTVATGGFSTRNDSIGHWSALPSVDLITIVFMFLGGVNFALYYVALFQRRPRAALRDRELWLYSAVTLFATLVATLWLWLDGGSGLRDTSSLVSALRYASFQVVSVVTTTGYVTDNLAHWAPVLMAMLIALMFMGGCAGSTSGGLKVFRVLVVFKAVLNEIYRAFRPESIRGLRVGDAILRPAVVQTIVVFTALFVFIWALVTIFVAAFGHDLITSATAALACFASIGPGLGEVHGYASYAFFEAPVKWALSICMILGRLELFTILVLFVPSFWRR